MIITIAPTLIGEGIPLFKEGIGEIEFSLKGMKQYNQFAELHYERKKGQ
jgi:dihydrofolate reductase